jgi:HAD superfamily hydrolase (TIGR01450 family)
MRVPEYSPIDWNSIDAVVADLDGTLYLGESPLAGAIDFVQIAGARKPLFFLSNNTSKTPDCTFEKLIRLGFDANPEQVLSPLHGLVSAIRALELKHLWILANCDVLQWLGARLPNVDLKASRAQTECVILAYDDTLVYQDLCEVAWRIQDGATYWITHPDYVCPHPDGPVPDVGGLVELFAVGTGCRPSRVFGKPSSAVLSELTVRFTAERILFIGDRLYTDWELARRTGCQFRLVLSGETTLKQWDDLGTERPLLLDIHKFAH